MEKHMKAAVMTGVGQIEIRHMAIPQPQTGEVLINAKSAGLCGSDVSALEPGGGIRMEPGVACGHCTDRYSICSDMVFRSDPP